MLQGEFLSRQSRRYARAKKHKLLGFSYTRGQLDRFMNQLALIMLAFMAGLFIAQVVNRLDNPFNYEMCDYMVAAGNLSTAPIPSDRTWNEIRLTPGGNWCIATDLND